MLKKECPREIVPKHRQCGDKIQHAISEISYLNPDNFQLHEPWLIL